MPRPGRREALLSFLFLLLTALPALVRPARAEAPSSPAPPKLEPCRIEGVDEEVRCATYPVWEDRAARAGRRIGLRVVVLPARGPERAQGAARGAILFFPGGLAGAVELADQAAQLFAPLRGERDVLLVDARGTGGSNPLACDLYDGGVRLDPIFPPDTVRACRERLEKAADLRFYTTTATVEDLDEVRAWLGYPQVDLYAASWGTRAAQVYLRRFPDRVRSAVLRGVATLADVPPLHLAESTERILDLVAQDCAADPGCRAAFPRFRKEFDQVLGRLAAKPARVEVRHPGTGKPATVELTRSAAADALRTLLYGAQGAGGLPLLVHRAATGDLAGLAGLAVEARHELGQGFPAGLLLSTTCAEDAPFLDPAAIPAATRGTFLGDDRVRAQIEACELWPRGEAPAGFHQAVRADVPVLLVSGERDPVTPAVKAAEAARALPRGRHVVFPGAGHGVGGPCFARIVVDFLRRGTAEGLDTSCLGPAEPIRFATRPH